MSQSLQPHSAGPDDLWARFSARPQSHPTVRASDADRDVAAEVINAAFSDGRLDKLEHADRLEAVLGAKTLGELVPLLSDVTIAGRPEEPTTPVARVRAGAVRAWLGLALLFNVIWVATWLLSGDAPYYYWPIWPMIGTAIPVVIAYLFPDRGADPDRVAERAERREMRAERREVRADRRQDRRDRRQLGR